MGLARPESRQLLAMSTPNEVPGGEMLVYQAADGSAQVEVWLERETVWLSQAQMSQLFGRDQSVISRHLGNVFREGELDRAGNMQKMHIANSDKPVELYNLDVIISVGYRVKSAQGTRFRQWATGVLREHLVRGYTYHQTRLAERGLREARETLELLSRTLQNQELVDETGRAVLELITSYADTWRLLLEYDEDRLATPPGTQPARGVLDYARASAAIADFGRELRARGEASALFGHPRGQALASI